MWRVLIFNNLYVLYTLSSWAQSAFLSSLAHTTIYGRIFYLINLLVPHNASCNCNRSLHLDNSNCRRDRLIAETCTGRRSGERKVQTAGFSEESCGESSSMSTPKIRTTPSCCIMLIGNVVRCLRKVKLATNASGHIFLEILRISPLPYGAGSSKIPRDA